MKIVRGIGFGLAALVVTPPVVAAVVWLGWMAALALASALG